MVQDMLDQFTLEIYCNDIEYSYSSKRLYLFEEFYKNSRLMNKVLHLSNYISSQMMLKIQGPRDVSRAPHSLLMDHKLTNVNNLHL